MSEDSFVRLAVGARVDTRKFGLGTVIGKEPHYNEYRILVALDDPKRWACYDGTNNVTAWWPKELYATDMPAPSHVTPVTVRPEKQVVASQPVRIATWPFPESGCAEAAKKGT